MRPASREPYVSPALGLAQKCGVTRGISCRSRRSAARMNGVANQSRAAFVLRSFRSAGDFPRMRDASQSLHLTLMMGKRRYTRAQALWAGLNTVGPSGREKPPLWHMRLPGSVPRGRTNPGLACPSSRWCRSALDSPLHAFGWLSSWRSVVRHVIATESTRSGAIPAGRSCIPALEGVTTMSPSGIEQAQGSPMNSNRATRLVQKQESCPLSPKSRDEHGGGLACFLCFRKE